MACFIGLDVSQRSTAICVVDDDGNKIAEGKAITSPADIHAWITKRVDVCDVERIGLEAGSMSFWLYTGLADLGMPMICIEAFQAAQLLKTQRNKTDKNDARGLAQIVRLGGSVLRCVTVRSQSNQELRTLLTMRHYMVSQKLGVQNSLTGVMKQYGLIVRRGGISAATFRECVLMALSHACDVGAYFGLTPRQYQSGEIDIRGNASRRGDIMTRSHLIQAATVMLTATNKWCTLRAWGMKIAKQHGLGKARVALARKLASVLWLMWTREQDFIWSRNTEQQEACALAA
jgi:transposase